MNSLDNVDVAYIELLGITLSGVKRPDQGLYWTDLSGWRGLTPSRGSGDDRPGANGQFRRGKILRSRRVIKLVGHILTKNNRELMVVMDRLERALSQGSGIMTVVTNTGGSWERFVEIDTLDIEPDHGKSYTKFTVDMVAPDPYRYGPLQTIGPVGLPSYVGGLMLPQALPWNLGSVSGNSALTIHNSGGITLFPMFQVSRVMSSLTKCSVIDTTSGRSVTLDRPVSVGQDITFDTKHRRVYVDGQDVTRFLTSRQWFSIPVEETREFRLEAYPVSSDPLMTSTFQIGEQ